MLSLFMERKERRWLLVPSELFLEIMQRMLNRAPTDMSRREGSLIYESAGMSAAEFELVYQMLELTEENAYPLTADREHLMRHAEIYGYYPEEASKAIVRAEIITEGNIVVDNGTQFMIKGVYFTVIEHEHDNDYLLECDTPGVIGNSFFRTILPALYITGFKSAKIKELVVPGEDEEDTEAFRERYRRSFNRKSYGGNESEYIDDWVMVQDGVGDCKVLRCPRGAGTVDVIIINSLFEKPDEELIQQVQEALQPKNKVSPAEIESSGLGLTPIGHDVVVRGVRERKINIELGLVYDDGYDWEGVQEDLTRQIKNYFKSINQNWGDSKRYTQNHREYDYKKVFVTVLISRLEALLLDVQGVVDYHRDVTKLNGADENISLDYDEIPVLGELIEVKDG